MVAVVDLKRNKVLHRWSVTPGGYPVGVAIDARTNPAGTATATIGISGSEQSTVVASRHHLFIGCRKPAKMVVMSTQTGRVEASLPIGMGNDAARFEKNHAFASCGDGIVSAA